MLRRPLWERNPVPWREPQKGQSVGWGRVLLCLRLTSYVTDSAGGVGHGPTTAADLLPGACRFAESTGEPRDVGSPPPPAVCAGEQDTVHARATGSRVPPTYVTRAACVPRKHVTLCKSASTSASNPPWIPREADGPRRGAWVGAAGRAAARRPPEAPDGKVPRRLPDNLPGSGGFYSARLKLPQTQ